MAEETTPLPTSKLGRMHVNSQSNYSTKDELVTSIPTPIENASGDSNFVQMAKLIEMDDAPIVPRQLSAPIRVSAKDNTVEISAPQSRLSRKTHGRRRGGSSMMGDKIVNVNVRLNIPDTVIDEEASNSLKVDHELSGSHSDMIDKQETLEIISDRDPINEIIEIVKKSVGDRTKNEIDILVNYFEHFKIMSADVDQWSGQHTFRALIRETKYKRYKKHQFVYTRDTQDDLCFYFILKGAVQLSESDEIATIFEEDSNPIILCTDHDIFGEKEMYTLEPRLHNCVVASGTVHLAYWDKDAYNDYIRPIKELNTNIKQEKGLLHDKHGNLLTESDLIEKASMFLDDAIHGRSFKMHRNGKWPRKVHRILIHKYFRYFIVSVCLLWLLLLWMEPPSSIVDNTPDTTQYNYIMQCIWFEWLVFFIFLAECLARVFSYGSRWFFTNQLHSARVVLLVIFLIDLSLATLFAGAWFRFSRVFRPFFLMLFIRDLRRQYFILISCVPSVLELIMLFLAVVGVFARIGYHIFDHTELIYNQDEFLEGTGVYEEYLYGVPGSEDALFVEVWRSFTTFFYSCITLFVLLTTENYPEVFWPAWVSEHVYFGYFMIYILISTFFLMNLFSAAVYNAYKSIISDLDVLDEGREATALRVAWDCLDYDEKGYIEKDRFVKLLRKLKPNYSQFEIDVLFTLMDQNGDGEIEVLEFSEFMINCLYFSITTRTKTREDELKLYLQRLGRKLGPYGYDILSAFTSTTYAHIMLLFVSLDVCFLLSYHFSVAICNYGDAVCLCVIVLNIFIDIIFKHQSQVRHYFKSTKNTIFFVITLIQCVGTAVGIVDTRTHRKPNYLSGLRFFGISRVLLMAEFLRERFSFLKHSTSNTLTQTMIYMIPIFLRICFYIYVGLVYMFTVVGMELFYDWNDEDTYGQIRCDGHKQMASDPAALFCDASATFLTLFQILTTNNWHIVMYQAMETTDNHFVSIYFILFFVLGPILTVNFLLAVFFDMFFGVNGSNQDTEDQEDLKDALLDATHPKEQLSNGQITMHTLYSMESPDGAQLPVEPGLSSLSDGTKILTVPRTNVMRHNADIQIVGGGDLFVHLSLMSVAKTLWQKIETQDYTDGSGNVYRNAFTGKAAVQCILSLGYAPDEEDALDYLAQIMDDEAVFSRIVELEETGTRRKSRAHEFENGENAHYQWIMNMRDIMNDEINDEDMMKKEEIMIGVRHSYGGFQRLMKQNRRLVTSTAAANTPATVNLSNDPSVHTEANQVIKSTTTMFSDSETPRNVATPKQNIFSTRNLLSFQQQASTANLNNVNSNTSNNDAQDRDDQIENGLVIVIGAYDSEMESVNAFEQNYNYAVIHADDVASLTVSKYFNVDKYDAVILIASKVTDPLDLKAIYRLLTKKLNLKQMEKIPKLVIYIKDEFEEEQEAQEEKDEEEDDAFEEEKEELLELFGLIQTSDGDFTTHFMNHLSTNKHAPQSIIVLINNVRKLIENNVYLNHFDPRLLLHRIMPNSQ